MTFLRIFMPEQGKAIHQNGGMRRKNRFSYDEGIHRSGNLVIDCTLRAILR